MIKDLPELIEAGVISEETAGKITAYYRDKKATTSNRLFIVFGILGSMLVGTGIILMLAHNWDNFSRWQKTILAFIPLLAGQILCGYATFSDRLKGNITWRESSATFLFFAVGACTALISQIYHITGSMESYLLSWMLLSLPLAYIMPSSAVSLLYIIGITAYGTNADYWSRSEMPHYLYWLLLMFLLPSYYRHLTQKRDSNFTLFHHWGIALSVAIMLGALHHDNEWKLTAVAYAALFGMYYLVGNIDYFQDQKRVFNSYSVIGLLGMLTMYFMGGYKDFWGSEQQAPLLENSTMWIPVVILMVISVYLLYQIKALARPNMHFLDFGWLVFALAAFLSVINPVLSAAVINIYLLAAGIQLVIQGVRKENLALLNLGLIIVALLITMRFFDIDMTFALRGLLFVLLGGGFFMANYWMLKNKKRHE